MQAKLTYPIISLNNSSGNFSNISKAVDFSRQVSEELEGYTRPIDLTRNEHRINDASNCTRWRLISRILRMLLWKVLSQKNEEV